MPIRDLILKNRSYRRFDESRSVSTETLRELVDLARLSASGANLQPLKYVLSADTGTNERIFPCTAWAGYLREWDGPAEGERPAAYIVILNDTEIKQSAGCDHGIAAQSILLGATEKGLGGCMIASLKKERLREVLSVPDRYEILLVIALGVPAETVVIDEAREGEIKYWRDENGVHHVPKRSLDEIVLDFKVL